MEKPLKRAKPSPKNLLRRSTDMELHYPGIIVQEGEETLCFFYDLPSGILVAESKEDAIYCLQDCLIELLEEEGEDYEKILVKPTPLNEIDELMVARKLIGKPLNPEQVRKVMVDLSSEENSD